MMDIKKIAAAAQERLRVRRASEDAPLLPRLNRAQRRNQKRLARRSPIDAKGRPRAG